MASKLKVAFARGIISPVPARLIRLATRGRLSRWGVSLDLSSPHVPDRLVAGVFFGLHESAEIRTLEALESSFDHIIDLGCSTGVLGAIAASRASPSTYTGVEANEALLMIASRNVRSNAPDNCNVEVIHGAVHYHGPTVRFAVGDHLVDSSVGGGTSGTEVPAVVVSSLVERLPKDGTVLMISDIEGAEWDLFESDAEALGRVDAAIVEVHFGDGRNIEHFMRLATDCGFEVAHRDGPVILLRRR